MSELNKRMVRLFVEAVLNEGRLELIDELIAADFMGHIPCAEEAVTGPEGVRQLVSVRPDGAQRDLHVTILDQVAEDDRVVIRWQAVIRAPGTRTPCGKQLPCCAGISVIRLLAGKQVDSRTECTRPISGCR